MINNNINIILNLKDDFSRDLSVLFYNGVFSDVFSEIIVSLTDNNEQKTIKKKISFLVVEVFQNIVRHGEAKDKATKENIFGMRNKENILEIFSSNIIDDHIHDLLEQKLSQINKLNSEELKIMYRSILSSGEFSEKGGAGLGLIEMARKSGNKIQYSFDNDEDSCKFSYQLDLSTIKGKEININDKTNIKENIRHFSTALKNDILFLYKGDFKGESRNALLSILRDNTQAEGLSKNTEFNNFNIFHTGVELIQNICRHGKEIKGTIEGIFSLIKTPIGYYICTGNYLESDGLSQFEEHVLNINEFKEEKLNEIYLKTLKENSKIESNSAGIGLLDVRRYNKSLIDYKISRDDFGSYLCIGILIPILDD
jgi:hypothetical protein